VQQGGEGRVGKERKRRRSRSQERASAVKKGDADMWLFFKTFKKEHNWEIIE
jgi:hypothetical protein